MPSHVLRGGRLIRKLIHCYECLHISKQYRLPIINNLNNQLPLYFRIFNHAKHCSSTKLHIKYVVSSDQMLCPVFRCLKTNKQMPKCQYLYVTLQQYCRILEELLPRGSDLRSDRSVRDVDFIVAYNVQSRFQILRLSSDSSTKVTNIHRKSTPTSVGILTIQLPSPSRPPSTATRSRPAAGGWWKPCS